MFLFCFVFLSFSFYMNAKTKKEKCAILSILNEKKKVAKNGCLCNPGSEFALSCPVSNRGRQFMMS